MNIAIDYDNTYTRQPAMWDEFIRVFRAYSVDNNIYCVSSRSQSQSKEVVDALFQKVNAIFFTDRVAKEKYMFDKRISIDVWIDDCPFFITNDAKA